jgi:hypothetical protein
MFRAVRCSSSGGLIVSMQPLISSLSVGDCPVHRLRKFFLNDGVCKSKTMETGGRASRMGDVGGNMDRSQVVWEWVQR